MFLNKKGKFFFFQIISRISVSLLTSTIAIFLFIRTRTTSFHINGFLGKLLKNKTNKKKQTFSLVSDDLPTSESKIAFVFYKIIIIFFLKKTHLNQ